ncbi:hypothetical protein ACGFH8_17635 [Micromonospora sp. NPDC049175]|uniref:hypothetical protein n=1 Tax=Micromonospora sp. NPDC049175 TaxID=3364266 RepID=UPI0037127668
MIMNAAPIRDSGDERETAQAAANLWSRFGYLDARADMLRMFVGALEVGYMTALSDVRDGNINVEL